MAASEVEYGSSHCQEFVERTHLADVNPPTDEVIAALVQMALLVLILAAVVLATHALQISFDARQAQRARQTALESSRQRLHTLSDRNAPNSPTTTTTTTSIATTATGAPPSLPPTPPHFPSERPCTRSYSSRSNSLDSAEYGMKLYQRSHSPHPDTAGDGCTPATPTIAGGSGSGGGGATTFLAAAGSLLQRRHTTAVLLGCSAGTSGDSTDINDHTPADRLCRERSQSSNLGCATHPSRATEGQLVVYKAGVDSLLDASQVWGSVPLETITSTRQVLAAFNYDYSALRRREISYVGGVGTWQGRSGFSA